MTHFWIIRIDFRIKIACWPRVRSTENSDFHVSSGQRQRNSFSEILLNLSILEFRCKISKRPFGFCGCCLAFPQKSCPTFHYLYACCVDILLLYFYNYKCRFSIFYYLLVTKKLMDYLGTLRTNQEHVVILSRIFLVVLAGFSFTSFSQILTAFTWSLHFPRLPDIDFFCHFWLLYLGDLAWPILMILNRRKSKTSFNNDQPR